MQDSEGVTDNASLMGEDVPVSRVSLHASGRGHLSRVFVFVRTWPSLSCLYWRVRDRLSRVFILASTWPSLACLCMGEDVTVPRVSLYG